MYRGPGAQRALRIGDHLRQAGAQSSRGIETCASGSGGAARLSAGSSEPIRGDTCPRLPGAVRTGSTSPPKVEAVSEDAVVPKGRHWFLPEDPNPGARQTDKTRACGFPGAVLSWMRQEQPLWPLCLCHLEMSLTWVSGRMGSFAV